MAGVIKVLLSMRHRQLPPHIHLKELNPLITLSDEQRIRIPTSLTPWVPDSSSRDMLIAGVSTFGFSGTNAHIVFQSWGHGSTSDRNVDATPTKSSFVILPLSAQNEESLLQLGVKYDLLLAEAPEENLNLASLCYTAAVGRTHFKASRTAVVGDSVESLRASLALLRPASQAHTSSRVGAETPRVVFCFSGQGSEYRGMGKELWAHGATFRESLIECDALWQDILRNHESGQERKAGGQTPSLLSVIFPEEGERTTPSPSARLEATCNAQPALLAFEYALVQQWRAWEVTPAMVLGHSLGEITAAVVAGVLSLREGLALAGSRGWWMEKTRVEGGAMAAVFESHEEVKEMVRHVMSVEGEGVVCIAAVNGPTSVVVSGSTERVHQVLREAEARGKNFRQLDMRCAFHSPLLDPAMGPWRKEVAAILQENAAVQHETAQPILISNTVAGAITREQARDPEHWIGHALGPVLLWPSVVNLIKQGSAELTRKTVFLEIGPASMLVSLITRGLSSVLMSSSAVSAVPSMVKDKDSWRSVLDALGRVYTAGVNVDWPSVFDDIQTQPGIEPLRIVPVPTYPFRRIQCWMGPYGSPRLGIVAKGDAAIRSWIPPDKPDHRYFAWSPTNGDAEALSQHLFRGYAVLPAAAMLSLVHSFSRGNNIGVKELSIFSRVTLPLTSEWDVQMVEDKSNSTFDLYYAADSSKGLYHKFATSRNNSTTIPREPGIPLLHLKEKCTRELSPAALYAKLFEGGLEYGTLFKGVTGLWTNASGALLLAALKVPRYSQDGLSSFLPAVWVIDAMLHAAGGFGLIEERRKSFLPVSFEDAVFRWPVDLREDETLWCTHLLHQSSDEKSLITEVKMRGHLFKHRN